MGISDTAPPPPRLLMSVEEAAYSLGLAPSTLKNWIHFQRVPFPTYKLGGRRLIRTVDLEAFVASLADTPSSLADAPEVPAPAPAPAESAPAPKRRGRPRNSERVSALAGSHRY
jgi:excisionase family DNA binding protein